MKRRTFLFLTVAGAAALAPPFAGCRYYDKPLMNILTRPGFLEHICDQKTIAEIGSAYCTAVPGEANSTDLIRLLLDGTPGAHDYTHLSKYISDKVRTDFTTDDTVTVKGWVLSRTEARQCALYTFSLQ